LAAFLACQCDRGVGVSDDRSDEESDFYCVMLRNERADINNQLRLEAFGASKVCGCLQLASVL